MREPFDPYLHQIACCPQCGGKDLLFVRQATVTYSAPLYEKNGYLTWQEHALAVESESVIEEYLRCRTCFWDSRDHEVDA